MVKGLEVVGGDWRPIDDHSVGWPYFLGGIFSILGIQSQEAATLVSRVVSAVLVAAAVFPFGLLCRRILPASAAIVAVATFSLFPPLLAIAPLGLSEPLFIFVVLWMAYFIVRADDDPHCIVVAACLAGLAYYVRPTGIVMLFVVVASMGPLVWKGRMGFGYLLLVPLVFALTSAPNLYLRHDAFGSAFYYGNNSKLFVDSYDEVWTDSIHSPSFLEYLQTHSVTEIADRFLINGVGQMTYDLYQVLGEFWFFVFFLACLSALVTRKRNFKEFAVAVCLFLPLLILLPIYAIFHNDRHVLISIPFVTVLSCRFLFGLFEKTDRSNVLAMGLLALVVSQTFFAFADGDLQLAGSNELPQVR